MTVLKVLDSNVPTDKRIENIERVVSRLARRSHKIASALIAPYPISNCVTGENVKGDILRYLFPAKGRITKGLIFLDSRPKTGFNVEISLNNDAGGLSTSYIVSRRSMALEPNMEVFSSDRLIVSIEPITEEDIATEVWISLLWTPTIKDASVRSFLIDELEKEVDLS